MDARCSPLCWEGGGLRFREWRSVGDEAGEKGARIADWAENQAVDRETLNFLAHFLLDRGYVDEGRDFLEDAKEIAYNPGGDFNKMLRSLASALTDHVILDYVTWLYLLPTGYGAKPERALVILFFFWLFGLCIYLMYNQACRAHRIAYEQARGLTGVPGAGTQTKARWWGRAWMRAGDWWTRAWMKAATVIRLDVPPLREGASEVDGFNQFDETKLPKSFSIIAFATDATLPFINLHAYGRFYPVNWLPKSVSFVQHFMGWWMITSFVAAAAVL